MTGPEGGYLKDAVAAAGPSVDFSRYDMVHVLTTRDVAASSFTPTYVYEPATADVRADGDPGATTGA
ncbi:hypothetical protein ACWFR1_13270 [Streptomyces sp. NPDC055103]